MKKIAGMIYKNLYLYMAGSLAYCIVEILFRGYTFYSMAIVGGICFMLCGWLNEIIPWEMSLLMQMFICCILITVVEFVSGWILNIKMGLNIWNYSNMPLNFKGQICVPFTVAWFFLSAVGIMLDDYLRYGLFGEEKPHYVLWRKKKG